MELLIYLWFFLGQIQQLNSLFVVFSIFAIIVSIVYWIAAFSNCGGKLEKDMANAKNLIKKSIIALCIFLLINLFLPNKNWMLAIYLVPKILRNEQVITLPTSALNYLHNKLEEKSDHDNESMEIMSLLMELQQLDKK